VRSVTVGPHRAAQATDFDQGRIGLQAMEWHRDVTTPVDELRAQLRQQQVVLISDPARDQERIDEHPNDGDQHPHDRQRQNELRDRDAGALEIEVVGAEQPQEKPQYIGDERSLLVGLGMGVYRSFNRLEWQTISRGTVDAQKLSRALANRPRASLSSDRRLAVASGLANGSGGPLASIVGGLGRYAPATIGPALEKVSSELLSVGGPGVQFRLRGLGPVDNRS
jgi:hypothetical protein